MSEKIQTSVQIRVRYQETDQMGVAYHGNYFAWFEVSRTELFREINLVYTEMEKAGILLPVAEVQCRYRMPAHYDDLLTVSVRVEEATPVRITFSYRILRGEDLVAEGKTFHAFVNREGRPVSLKKVAPEFWEKVRLAAGVEEA